MPWQQLDDIAQIWVWAIVVCLVLLGAAIGGLVRSLRD